MDKTLLAIDIETVSQGKRANDYTDGDTYDAPKNIKDEAKIEANIEGQRIKAKDKHALHWWTGKVVSVATVDVFGDRPDSVHYGHDEQQILTRLREELEGNNLYVIGKTSGNFDWPFLIGRYMANLMRVPNVLRRRYNCLDVDNFFGFSAASGQRAKLDHYAQGIGYAGKPMHGSQVGSLYQTILNAEMNNDVLAAKAAWVQLEKYNLHDANVVKALATLYYNHADNVGGR